MTELFSDSTHTRADLQLVKSAIVNGWDIPEQLFSALPKVAGAMALTGKGREKTTAMQILLKMKEQNDRREPEQPAKKVEHYHTHEIELGPVTAENLEQHKARALARISGSGRDA